MTHRLATNYAKNYCNRTLIVKVIVENVVTWFLGTRCSWTKRGRVRCSVSECHFICEKTTASLVTLVLTKQQCRFAKAIEKLSTLFRRTPCTAEVYQADRNRVVKCWAGCETTVKSPRERCRIDELFDVAFARRNSLPDLSLPTSNLLQADFWCIRRLMWWLKKLPMSPLGLNRK